MRDWLPTPEPWENEDEQAPGFFNQPDDYEALLQNYLARQMEPQQQYRPTFADRFADNIAHTNFGPQKTFLGQVLSGGAQGFARGRIAARPQMESEEDRMNRIRLAAQSLREHREYKRKLAEPPTPVTLGPGQSLVNPRDGRPIASLPAKPEKPERVSPVTVGEGQTVIDPATGRVIFRGPPKSDAKAKAEGAASNGYSVQIARDAINAVDGVFGKIGPGTTGAIGKAGSFLPGTPAYDVSSQLKEVTSNVAFQALAQMRAASKTGGALGAVSDKEGQLLQSVKGSVDQGQSDQQVRRSLRKIKASMMRMANAAAQDDGLAIPFPQAPEWNYDGNAPLPGESASASPPRLPRTPQATPNAGGRIRVRRPDGQTGTVSAGSKLPAGWTVLP